jgi:hypothetical protein
LQACKHSLSYAFALKFCQRRENVKLQLACGRRAVDTLPEAHKCHADVL